MGLRRGRRKKGEALCPAPPYGRPCRRSGRSPPLPYPPHGQKQYNTDSSVPKQVRNQERKEGASLSLDNTYHGCPQNYGKTVKKTRDNCDQPPLQPEIMILEPSSNSYESIAVLATRSNRKLLSIALYDDGSWIVYDPQGFFDASPEAGPHFTWQQGYKTYPAGKYWNQYYRPGLMAEVFKKTYKGLE
jgi:hypothetical protein